MFKPGDMVQIIGTSIEGDPYGVLGAVSTVLSGPHRLQNIHSGRIADNVYLLARIPQVQGKRGMFGFEAQNLRKIDDDDKDCYKVTSWDTGDWQPKELVRCTPSQ